MEEVETKVLNVNPGLVRETLERLGAEKTQETRLFVRWFWRPEDTEGEEPWFLRTRSGSLGRAEVTWKARSQEHENVRRHKEIHFSIPSADLMADLFLEIGLVQYAYQEKDRISWKLRDWKFDLDSYPGMPSYLEIEGVHESHVLEAIRLLGLHDHRTWSRGERILIKEVYGLDWFNMRF